MIRIGILALTFLSVNCTMSKILALTISLYLSLLSEGVTVTNGDCRLLGHNYRHVITQQVYISYKKSNLHLAYRHKLFLMSCLCPHDEAAFPLNSGKSLVANDSL